MSLDTTTLKELQKDFKGTTIASATTTDLSAATGDFVDVSGTTTITGLGTVSAGVQIAVRFTGILTLTHNATSLILPSAANITTGANDCAIFRSLGSGNWQCISYSPGAGGSGTTNSGAQNLTNKTITSGVLTTCTVTTSLVPTTNDGAPLGDTTHQFSDLFLAEGGVINFDNGDATITQAGNLVTLAGAALVANVNEPVTTISGDGAVTIASGTVLLTKGSAAAITVAAPSSQDGVKIRIISNSDFAHVITFTGSTLLDGTTGANLTVTMTAFKGSAIEVVASGTNWFLVSSSNVTSITA